MTQPAAAMGATMTTNQGLRPVQKAVQGVFLAYLYIQVIQVCTACAAIYLSLIHISEPTRPY